MADEFQAAVCNGNWWNSSRTISTPCSTTLSDVGSFGWPNEMEMKVRSCEDSVSVSCNSMVYQNTRRPQESDSIGGGSGGLMDSTLQMMSYSLSDWNQALVSRTSGRSPEQNLGSSHGQKDWSPKNFCDGGQDPSINPFKHINQMFVFEQHDLDSSENSGDCKVNYPIASASTLLPGLLEPDLKSHQPPYCMMNYSSPMNYHMDMNEMTPSIPQFIKNSSLRQQSNTNQLHFSNNTPFWNASADSRSSISSSPQSQFPNCSNLARKFNSEDVRDSSSVMKQSNEPTFKRPRIETPSPLPTFKVRKEKLGDRVTALQQLVSPFGKTDTASVLFEAIEYIKFLHDQLGVLSTPYKKNGAPMYQQKSDKSKDAEGLKHDLKSRGLCLVPVSSTFSVTNETTADFWTPTFGGSYR